MHPASPGPNKRLGKLHGQAWLLASAGLLTLNQGLSESMDALQTRFQGKVFAVALRKGVVRH